jgi:acylphosphatase
MEEAEAGFQQEWEELEAERLRLSGWERRLGDRIQVVASCATGEQAQLERERDVQRDKMHRVIDREIAVTHWEKTATQKEAKVELKKQFARHTINAAKTMAKMIDDERASSSNERWPSRRGRPASPPGPGTSRSGRPRWRDSWQSSALGSSGL